MGSGIEIVIQKGNTGEGTMPTGETPVDKNKDAGKTSVTQQAVNSALINSAKNIIVAGVQKSGDATGNYHAVEQFNVAMSIGADILIVAKGGAIGLLAVAGKHASNIYNANVDQKNADRLLALMTQRSGNNAVAGSRYKYDGR